MEGGRTVFILAASADIGAAMAGYYADEGHEVIGTFRGRAGVQALEGRANVTLLPCDVASRDSVRELAVAYAALDKPWDIFVSAVGALEPIGRWDTLDFDAWEQSVAVNSTAQLRVLHALYPSRRPAAPVHAAFFAGGGTNNPFTNYSAYCVSKILLMKMCELLDDELPDLNAFIVGPGFLPTKIHAPTFANPDAAGENYAKTVDFHSEQARAATCRDIYDCVNWCVAQGRDVVGGRNIAAVHDPWRSDGEWLAAQLRRDGNRFKLRRAGNIGTPAGVTR